MTSRERLLALLRGEPTDRIGVSLMGVRVFTPWWMANRHRSYAPLVERVRRHGDVLSGIGLETGFFGTAAPLEIHKRAELAEGHENVEYRITEVTAPHGTLRAVDAWHTVQQLNMPHEHFIKTPDDAENLLAIPYVAPQVDLAPVIERDRQIGPRGLVMIGIGSNPIGDVHALFGTERLALWSFEHRDLLHRLLAELLRRKLDLVRAVGASGLAREMPVLWTHVGAEAVVPPLAGPADFYDFCVRYDAELHAAMHHMGGYVRVHSHGSLSKVIEGFAEAGTDILQPVEPPPGGDITLAEAKRRVGRRLVLEGNIQFARLADEPPEAFRDLVRQAVAEGKPGGRFILSPTASPYWPVLPERALENYRTMIDVALTDGRYR